MYQTNERTALEILEEQERPRTVCGVKLLRYEGDVRFPESGLKSVVYIGEPTPKGFALRGTAFLTEITRPDGERYQYLVTAHHVIRDMKQPNRFLMRLNRADGTRWDLQSDGVFRWWRHPDRSVDAAVYPFTVSSKNFEYMLFPADRFVTPKVANQRNIGVGDEVFVVGLFRIRPGVALITPMVRTGHIAMMASERIPTTKYYGDAFMHLIEAFSLAGFSGSPVYVFETVSAPLEANDTDDAKWLRGTGNIFLLGLLHGILPVKVAEELTGESDPKQKWHSGISQVVPADQILEILNQPKLLEFEKEMKRKVEQMESQETSISDISEVKASRPKRKNRDIEIPPIARKKFFDDLTKATKRRTP